MFVCQADFSISLPQQDVHICNYDMAQGVTKGSPCSIPFVGLLQEEDWPLG
jgi:hypothetical protein